MIVAILAALLGMLLPSRELQPVIVVPPMPTYAPEISNDEWDWAMYHTDAYLEYADEFTALFNSYTYKRSNNGRSMINGKFVAMPKGS